jgi:hypothetical protein
MKGPIHRLILKECEYSVSTIEGFVRMLKKLADGNDLIIQSLKSSEKKVKQKHPGWEQQRGKEGCISQDLRNIVMAFPKGIKSREAEVSAFTFAASCGARVMTTTNVRLCDIISATLLPGMMTAARKHSMNETNNYFCDLYLDVDTMWMCTLDLGRKGQSFTCPRDVKIVGSWTSPKYTPQQMTKNPSNDELYYFHGRIPIGKHSFFFLIDGKKV